MKIYLDGSEAILQVTLESEDTGEAIAANSVEYAIYDGKGLEKQSRQALSGFTTGSTVASIPLLSSVNTMAAIGDVNDEDAVISVREARVIKLFVTDSSGNEHVLEEVYTLERTEVLIEGVNSFQSYPDALINAMSLTGVYGWNNAKKAERVAAMMVAARRMKLLIFEFESGDMSRINYNLSHVTKLGDLGKDDYASLDEKFRETLALAQILESNSILDDDETETSGLIASGVTRYKIGETEKEFSPIKSVKEQLCEEAMKLLRPYLRTRTAIGRS